MTTMQSGRRNSTLRRLSRDLRSNYAVYLLFVPVLAYYLIFKYYPMYGAQIAFRDFTPKLGITGSKWVGFKHFDSFFHGIYFGRLVRNTLAINVLSLLFGFPAPIILALMLNEVRNDRFKRIVQTVSYLPHFISTVVIAGMILSFTATDGFITQFIAYVNGTAPQNLLYNKDNYWAVYVISGIWQSIGWDSIIYIAALSGINQELYEAAMIDGASRWKQTLHITIPGIAPTIITMLILRMGSMMSLGYEKTLLIYNSAIYETADIISTYVYRKGLLDMNFSFSSAVGLFNSLVNLALIVLANYISGRVTDTSLW